MKTVFSHRFLKLFVPAVLIGNLLVAGQMSLLLPVCMDKGFSVEQYGYLTAIATTGSLLSVLILGVVKLHPKARYWVMTLGFSCAAPFLMAAYLTRQFPIMAILLFTGLFCNSAGNTILGAALMLALPEENRSSILGWVQSAITGGCALSVVLYGFLGELIPLHLAFAAGNLLALVPILYLCLHAKTKEFIRDNNE